MVVPDRVFDALLFGALLLALLLDNAFAFSPRLHGAASLLAVGLATYVAAQEMCDALGRRRWWTQESLATALALSTAGFVYYWWRNGSDLALLGLSIGMMMAALMIMIALLAALSACWAERGARPLVGLVTTSAGALGLGLLAGLLILVLSSEAALLGKAVVLVIGAVLWKLREMLRPPARNDLATGVMAAAPLGASAHAGESTPASTFAGASAADTSAGAAHPGARWTLVPQRGTLLDRFLPVLLLGALFFLALEQTAKQGGPAALWPLAPPASASSQDSDANGAEGRDNRQGRDASGANASGAPQ